jgi:hypothetical protein
MNVRVENIPDELKALPGWVVWRRKLVTDSSGKSRWTKVPFIAKAPDRKASSTDSRTWGDFETAVREGDAGGFDGIGVMTGVSPAGMVGCDLDHVLNPETAEIKPEHAWAAEIVRELDSYTEISPGGDGLRIFVFGVLPPSGRKREMPGGAALEVYDSRRFLTVTGRRFKDSPATIAERSAEIARIHARFFPNSAQSDVTALDFPNGTGPLTEEDNTVLQSLFDGPNGTKTQALFDGDTSDYAGDQSRADLALCGRLARATSDPTQIDRIFRNSKLYRAKWDERHGRTTYGHMTIEKALTKDTDEQAVDVSATPEPRDKRSAREAPALVRAYDLARETEENYDFIVEGLIARGGVTLLTAKPKFGKTVFAANLAIAVARGESFLTRKTKKGRVIYLGLEGYGQRRQLRELMQKLHVREDDDLFFYLAQSPRDAEEWLRKTVSEQKPNLIVLDTFGRLLRVKDVNDYAEVVKRTDPLLEIAQESGAAQLWLHHERKSGGNDGDESLGSTGILGSVDIQLSLRREADGTRTIRSTDSRLGEPLEPTLVRFDQATGRISLGGTKREAQRVALAEKVWQILSERGPLSLNEIVEAAEARRADVVSTLDTLAAAGKITVRGSGVRGNPKHYALADSIPDSVPNPIVGTRERNPRFERDNTAQASPTLHNTEMRTDSVPERDRSSVKAGNGIQVAVRRQPPTALSTTPPVQQAPRPDDLDESTLRVLRGMGGGGFNTAA